MLKFPTLLFALAGTAFTGIAVAQPLPDPRSPAEIAEEKAAQLRNNQPMSAFDVSQAVPYKIVSRSGIPGLVWIVAEGADTFEKRAHTALKAAEDAYNETQAPLVRAFLVTLPQKADLGNFHQAIATYEAPKRTWRAVAYDGPAIPEWRIKITEEWLDEADRVGGEAKINVEALKDRLGRQYNIRPDYVVPITRTEIELKPYRK